MDATVVMSAQSGEVGELGFAAVGPVLDAVRVNKDRETGTFTIPGQWAVHWPGISAEDEGAKRGQSLKFFSPAWPAGVRRISSGDIMVTIVRTSVQAGSTVVLPQEIVAALGSPSEVFLLVDEQKQMIVVSIKHPDTLHNEAILNQLAQLNEGLSLEEYGAPVSEDFLEHRSKGS